MKKKQEVKPQEWTLESLKSHAYDVIGVMDKLRKENKIIVEFEALQGELIAANQMITEEINKSNK
jgi:hypothetical protein